MTPTYCYFTVKRPARDGSDPGIIEEGWFIEEHGFVLMTTRDGKRLPGERRKIAPGQTAKYVATHLLKSRARSRPTKAFTRTIHYQKTGWL